jgi:hypothetical protein
VLPLNESQNEPIKMKFFPFKELIKRVSDIFFQTNKKKILLEFRTWNVDRKKQAFHSFSSYLKTF